MWRQKRPTPFYEGASRQINHHPGATMWRQSERRPKPFYGGASGQIRIMCNAPGSISNDNKRLLDDAVREMPNQRLKFEVQCTSMDDDAIKAFRRVILLNETLQWIKLPQSAFTSDGLEQLFACLEKAVLLKRLTLLDAKLTDVALPSLIWMIERSNSPFVGLERLSLPLCSFSEQHWIQLFQSLTANTTCSNFQLLDASLTDEVIPEICGLLRDNATLRQLRLHGLTNRGTVNLCQALRTNSTADSISLGYGPYLSEEATSSLCHLLSTNTTLKRLNIEDIKRKITSDVIQQLFESLQDNTTMTNVSMKTECTSEVLTEVWKALADDKKIKRLNFQNVILTDSAVPSLCQFIRCNRSVETFDLGRARFSADRLGKVLHALLANTNWQKFELKGGGIWDESVDHLCQLIETNRTLQELIVNWYELNATQVEQLCKLFCFNTSMKVFWLDMKVLPSDTLEYVSLLLDTGLESFVSEGLISDADFNLIFGIVQDHPSIFEAIVDPLEHQMIFKYRGGEGAAGLEEDQHQQHPSKLAAPTTSPPAGGTATPEVNLRPGGTTGLSPHRVGLPRRRTGLTERAPTDNSNDVNPNPAAASEDWSATLPDWSAVQPGWSTTASKWSK